VSDIRLYSSKGHDVDEMRAPEGKPTFVPTAGQESVERVVDFFFEGVRLLVEDAQLWAYVRAGRQPPACVEQYYANAGIDDGQSIPDCVGALRGRLEAGDRIVLASRSEMTTISTFAAFDPAVRSPVDAASIERQIDWAVDSDRPIRVATPGPRAAYGALVYWSGRVDSAVVAEDTGRMNSGDYDLALELGHDEWDLLGSPA
jgi:hypothetical protein